jgi:hypothetical protein
MNVSSGHTAGCRQGLCHSARGVMMVWGAAGRVNSSWVPDGPETPVTPHLA